MRRALKLLFAFLGLVVVAAIAAVLLIPRERIVALAADQVRAATGRELVLSGGLSPSFWPVLGVRTGPVTLSNAAWGEAENMISASAAEIGVELVALFSGEIKVTTLRLVDPVVALEINRDGLANWVFGDGSEPQGGGSGDGGHGVAGGLPKISLPEAVITNGRISYYDARSGQRIELTALDLTAGLEGLDKPLKLVGSGLWNGERASLEAVIDTPAAAMAGRRATVRVSLASNPASFSFIGDLQFGGDAALPLVNGRFTVDLPNPAAAVAWATGGRAPAGLAGLGAVKLDGSVSATEAALRFTATGGIGYKGRTVGFDLKADGAEGWLERQAFTVAVLGESVGLFRFTFSGPVSAAGSLAAEGPLKLTISDLRGLAEWAGGTTLNAPAGTLESASLDARLALRGDRIDLDDLTLRLDRTTMTGDAGVSLSGARPMITARLNSGPLDLSPFMASSSGGGSGSGGGAGRGWSTEPFDLSALRAVDAQVAIRAEAVDLGDIEIGRSDIEARLRDGRLDLTIDRVDAYGGGMTGAIMLRAGEEARLSADLTISAVRLRPLLNALAGFDSLEGLGAFRIKVDGRGRSMDALMKSLDGQGTLDLTDGAILGLNLAALVRNLTGQGGGMQNTDFSAVTGSFDITDGVLHNTDFSFLGPLLRVIGAGTVDIGRRQQNFRLEPTAVSSLTGQGGVLEEVGLGIFPILVTGTWSNPKFRPDLTAAIEGLLGDPERTLEAIAGLVEGADPAQAVGALLGAVTGDGEDSPAGALGQLLGSLTGGTSGGGDDGAAANPSGALGSLLGALGGGSRGQDDGSVAQPSYGDAQPEIDASALAPFEAPVPAPANREGLAALPRPPSSAAHSGMDNAVDEALSVPSPQYTPEPEPEQPAAMIWPKPETVREPEPEPVLQPHTEPEESAALPKAKRKTAERDADEARHQRREQDGERLPFQFRQDSKK